ncbi:MAG: hypothetical protein ACI8RZ_002552 [Myxococcota bacterium]|jgi:hypothetical protein
MRAVSLTFKPPSLPLNVTPLSPSLGGLTIAPGDPMFPAGYTGAVIFYALLLTLLGCNRNPCPSYVEAYNDCYQVSEPDSPVRLQSDYCADFDATSDDYFTCLAESYESGDCTTEDGIADIDAMVAECTL